MSAAIGSKEAQAYLIDPMNAPEPSAADGPGGSGFGSTFAPRPASIKSNTPSTTSSNFPPRKESAKHSTATKTGATSSVRPANRSPPEKFPDYRADAFSDYKTSSHRRSASNGTPPSYQEATTSNDRPSRRRGSSLKERYPGDKSGEPLDMIRRDSTRAHRSPHTRKKNLPGADSIDRLDPAIGGHAYHHEGPYDAALMSRNRDPKHAPVNAVEYGNREALKATPRENIKDAVERHKPLDGTAVVPPGEQDRFGRVYKYREGDDLMREATTTDAGYKRWPGREYDPEDLKGESEPMFSLNRKLKTHGIDENGIEMEDRNGTLDNRDPVEIAGGEGKYVDMELANAGTSESRVKTNGVGSLRKRIGSLKQKNREE